MIILYIINIIIMLTNVICIYILFNSIKTNKQAKDMNEIIEFINVLRRNNKFIVRNKKCENIAYLMHVAIRNNEPILILDVDYENK